MKLREGTFSSAISCSRLANVTIKAASLFFAFSSWVCNNKIKLNQRRTILPVPSTKKMAKRQTCSLNDSSDDFRLLRYETTETGSIFKITIILGDLVDHTKYLDGFVFNSWTWISSRRYSWNFLKCWMPLLDFWFSSFQFHLWYNIVQSFPATKGSWIFNWVEQSKCHCNKVEATVKWLTAQVYITWSTKSLILFCLNLQKRVHHFSSASAIILIDCWLSTVKFDFAGLLVEIFYNANISAAMQIQLLPAMPV